MSPAVRAALESLRRSLAEMDLDDDCNGEEDERRIGRMWADAVVLMNRLDDEETAVAHG